MEDMKPIAHVHHKLELGPCAKFGNNWPSSFGVIGVTHRQTDRQTDRQKTTFTFEKNKYVEEKCGQNMQLGTVQARQKDKVNGNTQTYAQ